jgi:hypothetical protein
MYRYPVYAPGGVGGVEYCDVALVLEPVEGIPEGGVRHRRPQRHRLLVLSTEEVVASKTHTHTQFQDQSERIFKLIMSGERRALGFIGKGSCRTSVADPELNQIFFHPGSEFYPSRIRITEFKYFNPKKWFLSSRNYDSGCSSRIRILTFYSSRIRIRNTVSNFQKLICVSC